MGGRGLGQSQGLLGRAGSRRSGHQESGCSTEQQERAVSMDSDPGSLRHQGQALPPGMPSGTCQAVGNILPSLLFHLGNTQALIILGGAKSSR